jgi:beta-lactamase regulating signal transducer with metallopeptidase domain
MIAAVNMNAIAQTSAVQIVDCLVEGMLIAIFAGIVLRVARRQSSGTRFAVWFSTLMAIAALPLFGSFVWSHVVSAGIATRRAITLPGSWAIYLFGAWAAIAAWLLIGIGRGVWHLHVLRKSCLPVDPAALDARLQGTLAHNRSKRPAKLYTSHLVHVPTAVGLLKPAILLPPWAMQELSPDELNQILLHELAHLRRWDDWTNLTQKVVKALLFFHPAVWWIEKRVSLEREMACDDAVLAETASPRAYAECLTRLAEKMLMQRSVTLAQAALGRIRQTSLRVAQILDVNRSTKASRVWKPVVSVALGFAVVCVAGLSRAPRLIAFSDSQNAPVASSTIAAVSNHIGSGRFMTGTPTPHVTASNTVFRQQPVRMLPASLTEHARAAGRKLSNSERVAATLSAARPTGFVRTSMVRSSAVQNGAVRTSKVPFAGTRQARRPDARGDDVHLANANALSVAFTETWLVVFESGENSAAGEPVYQIRLWRVMVLHPVVNPNSNRIPAKQT